MHYSGLALHSSLDNGRKSCGIRINSHEIAFTIDEKEIVFPLESTEISFGGASNRLIYFKHASYPDWCFYSGDSQLVKDPFLATNRNAKEVIKRVKLSNKLFVSVLLSIVLIIVLSLSCIIIFRKAIIFEIAQTVPVEWEQKAGARIFEAITLEKTLIDDVILNKQVNELGSTLTKVVPDKDFTFKFYIVEDSTLNAFALPGGNVVIHSGLILKAKSAEEVLGVLGHEIAHVTERHHVRGIITRMGLNFLLSYLFLADSDLADIIITTGGTLQSLKYDREFETESDNKGWEYLVKAGVNPKGMIAFFQTLQKESGSEAEPMLDFLSTHPATADRIKELNKKLNEENKTSFQEVDFDFKAFQKRLKETINN